MAKPEWGTKRICPSCGARYYDLRHDPIVCPKCGTQYDPEALLKTRRRAPVQAEPEPTKKVVPAAPEAGAEEPETEEEEATTEAAEEEEEEVPEDASELGEDEDDMAEVIENVDEEER